MILLLDLNCEDFCSIVCLRNMVDWSIWSNPDRLGRLSLRKSPPISPPSGSVKEASVSVVARTRRAAFVNRCQMIKKTEGFCRPDCMLMPLMLCFRSTRHGPRPYLLYIMECLFTAICPVLPDTDIRFDMLVGHPNRGPSFAAT